MLLNTKEQQAMLIEALDLKIASVKRALKGAQNPKFRDLYFSEEAEFENLRREVLTCNFPTPTIKKT